MYHPETMYRLVRERQDRFQDEARRDRLERAFTTTSHQEPRERFRIRDLRWVLFRPLGA
jgi:hypothetical protein